MPTEKKRAAVEALAKRMAECTIAISTDFSGTPVTSMTDLRKALREKGLEYLVVKNTLAYLAAEACEKPQLKEIIQGPTGLLLGSGDPVEAAKALSDYIRTTRSILAVRGASLDGRTLSAAEVARLAQLPPREQLLAQLMGQMQAPIHGLLRVLNGPLYGLATVLQRRVEQVQG